MITLILALALTGKCDEELKELADAKQFTQFAKEFHDKQNSELEWLRREARILRKLLEYHRFKNDFERRR